MTSLSVVTEFIVDSEHKTAPTAKKGYPYIRTPNIGRGYLILDNVRLISEKSYREWTRRAIPQKDDLILAREAPVGNVAIISDNIKICLGQRTVLIRPNRDLINPRYLMFLLLGDEIQNKFQAYSSGATVPHLNLSDIRSLELPELPSREIQDKIASVLGAFDDLGDVNLKRIKVLEDLARSLYNEWFVRLRFPGHEDTEITQTEHGPTPKGWEWYKLGEIVELAYGKGLKKSDRIPGEYPVYGSSGIIGFHNHYLVKGPTIIVGRKGNVGSVYWSYENCYPIDTVFYVNSDISLYFLYFNLQHQNFINSDAAVPGLSRNQAYTLPLLIPTTDIFNRYEEIVDPIFQEIRILTRKNEKIMEVRDPLLPKLISGEIDISNIDIDV